ncbi:recA bacterial DNA recombination family protein, partial [Chlamydia psittaci 84-8471/1]
SKVMKASILETGSK